MLKKIGAFLACSLLLVPFVSQAATSTMNARLNGKILLQVQSRGEAWYVNPMDAKRYFLGSPEMAIGVFSRVGLGITNSQLAQIPLGFSTTGELFGVQPMGVEGDGDQDGIPDEYEVALGTYSYSGDSDNDGYTDLAEIRAGYDPMKVGAKLPVPDKVLANRLKGRIVLQVESRGQAWYISPADSKRYYLGTPERALAGMRFFGLGITNTDLFKLQEGPGAIVSSPKLVDCGMTDIENVAAMQACFAPQFAACSPAKIRTEVSLAPLVEGVIGYEYEIIGRKNDGCEVKSRYISNPNPEYLNKNLFCRYDNRKPFNDAVQEVFPGLAACSGELKPYLTSQIPEISPFLSSADLTSRQCLYRLETEQLSCAETQMIFSSALTSGENGYRLEAGNKVTLPKYKLVSLQAPGNTDISKMYMLFLNRTGVYVLSEEETQMAVQQRAQNIIDAR